jgi:hypothetical protein
MRVPDAIARKILAGLSLGFGCDPNGMVHEWPPSANNVYPPVGYLRWTVLEVGNGDDYGYYWPVGREDRDPIVCATEHDAGRVVPIASTLAGCLRLVSATEPANADEMQEVAHAFGINLTGVRPLTEMTPAQALAELDPSHISHTS